MRYLILGAGALGGYFGAKLLQAGAEVTFLVRPRRAAQLAADGLVVRDAPEGDVVTPVTTIGAVPAGAHFDVIFLGCKAYDLDGAIDAVAPAVGPDTAIPPVLNGVRHIDILRERFGARHVLGGMTLEHGALSPAGEIIRSQLSNARGVTTFGELDGGMSARCQAILSALTSVGMSAGLSDQIMAVMWGKFPGFAAATTVTTLCHSHSGAIAASAGGRKFVDAVLDETDRIATAEGYPMPDATRELVHFLSSDPASGYGPSMLEDVEQGRRTEVEHIMGDLADRAERHGIAAPLMTAARCNLQVYEINRAKG